MRKPLFLTLLTLLALILFANSSCIQKIFSNKQYQCGKKASFDSSSNDFPSILLKGMEEFSVLISMTITDMCSAGYPFNLFTLKYSPNGTEVDVHRIEITALNTLSFYYEDSVGRRGGGYSSSTASYTQNASLEIYLSFNLTGGFHRLYYSTEKNNNIINFYGNYTGWKFDKTVRFLFCTDAFGVAVASCTIQVLAIENQYQSLHMAYRFVFDYLGGVEPVLIASYMFDQKSGTTIKNGISGQLGSAKFGTGIGKEPHWIKKDAGVEFTDSNQYIVIPTFTPKAGTPLTPISFTVSFWLKIKNESNSGFIFRYSRSNISESLFSILLNDDKCLQLQLGSRKWNTNTPLPFNTWNLVTTSFVCYAFSSYCNALPYLNETAIAHPYGTVSLEALFPFEASDVVLIGGPGGFKGKIVNFKIFNPGSQRLMTPTCEASSECLYTIGTFESTNKNCLQCASGPNFYSNCKVCPAGYYASGFECIQEEEKTFPGEAVSKGTAATAKTMTQAVSAVSAGSSAGISASISGKVFSNIKFINLSYSEDLEIALTTWKSNYFTLGFDVEMPGKLEKRFVNASLPYVFTKHEVNSCFLINFWEPLIMLLILIGFLVVILGLDWVVGKCMKKEKRSIQYRIITRVKVMILNFLIVQLYGMYGDIIFYGIVEFRSTQVTAGINFLSCVVAILLLVAMILGFFLHINLLKRYQNVKRNFAENQETKQYFDKFLADHEGIQVIFGDFKDESLVHQSFLFVLTIRDILFSIILSTLFEHPLTECVLILLMSIAILLYLFIKRPFKDVLGQVQQVILELITLAVNVSVLILAILDQKELEAFDQRNKIGRFLIIINMVFNFVTVFFMLLCLAQQGYEVYLDYKNRRKCGKNVKIKVSRNIINLQNVTSIVHVNGNTKKIEKNNKTCQTKVEDNEMMMVSSWKNSQIVMEQSLDSSGTINSFRNNSQVILREDMGNGLPSERRKKKWRKRKTENEQK